MNNGATLRWMIGGLLSVIVILIGTWAYDINGRVTIMSAMQAEQASRIASLEALSTDVQKRLERIEVKIDKLGQRIQ